MQIPQVHPSMQIPSMQIPTMQIPQIIPSMQIPQIQPSLQTPQTQTPKMLDEHIHSIAEMMAEEKHKDNIKKDTRAIKKKLIKTMNPSDDEDEEGEKEKPLKFKTSKQETLNTKIDDLENQNVIISDELEKVEHQNKLVKSCCADIEERLDVTETILRMFEERIDAIESVASFCEQLKIKINEVIDILNSNGLVAKSEKQL
jgi:hypothetical protein